MKKAFSFLIVLFTCFQLGAQGGWPLVQQQAKPWTRWWWMGSAVDTADINRQLTAYSKAGFGGVEVVPIYGAKGYEGKYLSYLSPQWMKMLDYTVVQAGKKGMGVYISVGTGWPIGGPQVTAADAATKLVVQQYTSNAGTPFTGKIVIADPKQKDGASLSALMAYGADGSIENITGKVTADGELLWKPVGGNYTLYAVFNGKTRQAVKRAAPGGEGFTLDHFSAASLNNYLKKFDTAFGKDLHGVKAFYNDSYEVYGADWTPGFFDEFEQRRGYDLRKYIRQFSSGAMNDTVARLKSDYRQTIADLMLHNFTEKLTDWSHRKKALSLNQAHGSPGNLLDLYAAVDIPECETFGSSPFPVPGLRRDSADVRNVDPDPNMLKFASSAAHVSGKKLVSSETFTWLGEHFKTSWSQCKPELEQVFLAGVNHMFYHGTTYSPAAAAWPGWLFYASLNVVPANSLWPHLHALNNYIARCQNILQQGEPDNEILVYWPVYDAWHGAKGMDMPLKVHDIDEWLHPTAFYKAINSLQKRGFAVDFVSDKMLGETRVINKEIKVVDTGAGYKVLVVPKADYLPQQTWNSIHRIAQNGGVVIMQSLDFKEPGLLAILKPDVRKQLPVNTTGNSNDSLQIIPVVKGRIIVSANIEKALSFVKAERETLTDLGLKFIRRKIAGGKYYYLVNHTANNIDTIVQLQYAAASAVLMDPQTGVTGRVPFTIKNNQTGIRLSLKSGEAMIVKVSKTKSNLPAWKYLLPSTKSLALNGKWKIHFTEGGPHLPADKVIDGVKPWTALPADSNLLSFSGTGVYSTSFTLKKTAPAYQLEIDSLYESARVIVNGKDAGIIWSIPYKLDISRYLKEGQNTISIEVANLMANRIRYMDRNKLVWKNYHEINFVDINYKPFDASTWKVMPSGLAGSIRIVEMKLNK